MKANRTSPSSASPDKIKIRTTQQNEEDFRYQSPPTKQKVYVSPSKHSSSSKKHSNPFGKSVEIIKDKLYWVSDKRPPQNIPNAFFFNIDNDLTYMPFNKDFGPLNLSMTHRFCRELGKLLNSDNFSGQTKIYHYTSAMDFAKITNACYLMCAFMIIHMKLDAQTAWNKFKSYHPHIKAFRDASKGECYYECTVLHCLEGL